MTRSSNSSSHGRAGDPAPAPSRTPARRSRRPQDARRRKRRRQALEANAKQRNLLNRHFNAVAAHSLLAIFVGFNLWHARRVLHSIMELFPVLSVCWMADNAAVVESMAEWAKDHDIILVPNDLELAGMLPNNWTAPLFWPALIAFGLVLCLYPLWGWLCDKLQDRVCKTKEQRGVLQVLLDKLAQPALQNTLVTVMAQLLHECCLTGPASPCITLQDLMDDNATTWDFFDWLSCTCRVKLFPLLPMLTAMIVSLLIDFRLLCLPTRPIVLLGNELRIRPYDAASWIARAALYYFVGMRILHASVVTTYSGLSLTQLFFTVYAWNWVPVMLLGVLVLFPAQYLVQRLDTSNSFEHIAVTSVAAIGRAYVATAIGSISYLAATCIAAPFAIRLRPSVTAVTDDPNAPTWWWYGLAAFFILAGVLVYFSLLVVSFLRHRTNSILKAGIQMRRPRVKWQIVGDNGLVSGSGGNGLLPLVQEGIEFAMRPDMSFQRMAKLASVAGHALRGVDEHVFFKVDFCVDFDGDKQMTFQPFAVNVNGTLSRHGNAVPLVRFEMLRSASVKPGATSMTCYFKLSVSKVGVRRGFKLPTWKAGSLFGVAAWKPECLFEGINLELELPVGPYFPRCRWPLVELSLCNHTQQLTTFDSGWDVAGFLGSTDDILTQLIAVLNEKQRLKAVDGPMMADDLTFCNHLTAAQKEMKDSRAHPDRAPGFAACTELVTFLGEQLYNARNDKRRLAVVIGWCQSVSPFVLERLYTAFTLDDNTVTQLTLLKLSLGVCMTAAVHGVLKRIEKQDAKGGDAASPDADDKCECGSACRDGKTCQWWVPLLKSVGSWDDIHADVEEEEEEEEEAEDADVGDENTVMAEGEEADEVGDSGTGAAAECSADPRPATTHPAVASNGGPDALAAARCSLIAVRSSALQHGVAVEPRRHAPAHAAAAHTVDSGAAVEPGRDTSATRSSARVELPAGLRRRILHAVAGPNTDAAAAAPSPPSKHQEVPVPARSPTPPLKAAPQAYAMPPELRRRVHRLLDNPGAADTAPSAPPAPAAPPTDAAETVAGDAAESGGRLYPEL